jgi:hypothetical protein
VDVRYYFFLYVVLTEINPRDKFALQSTAVSAKPALLDVVIACPFKSERDPPSQCAAAVPPWV